MLSARKNTGTLNHVEMEEIMRKILQALWLSENRKEVCKCISHLHNLKYMGILKHPFFSAFILICQYEDRILKQDDLFRQGANGSFSPKVTMVRVSWIRHLLNKRYHRDATTLSISLFNIKLMKITTLEFHHD